MTENQVRRSGRISLAVPILIIGSSDEGRVFSEVTHTVMLRRHGAAIVSKHKLMAEQELILRELATNREAELRVVGEIAEQGEMHTYGVAFLNETLDFWQIEFPPAPPGECRPAVLTLECSECRGVVELANADFEYDICVIHGGLTRHCQECGRPTIWRQAPEGMRTEPRGAGGRKVKVVKSPMVVTVVEMSEPKAMTAELVPLAERMEGTGRQSRACVATAKFGEDIVTCTDMSQGGVSFRTLNAYGKGMRVQIAVPYSPEAKEPPANFVQGRIVDVEEIESEGMWRCGVEFCLGGEGRRLEAGDQ
jgi:hypothetical protein